MIVLTESSPQLTESGLKAALADIPLDLPKIFLEFYSKHNGGVPSHAEVTDKQHVFYVHEFHDWSDIKFFKEDLDEYSVPSEMDHTKTLPFACDQGGNTFALYFEQADPKVYFYTTSDEMTIQGEWSSFSMFLEGFIEE